MSPGPVLASQDYPPTFLFISVFRFQLDELHLLLAISAPAPETSSSFDPMNSPVLMFGRCVRSALEALSAYREEIKVLRYCFDSIFSAFGSFGWWKRIAADVSLAVGAASCGIWLVQVRTLIRIALPLPC